MRLGTALLIAAIVFAVSQALLVRYVQGEQQRDADLQRFLALQELAAYRARLEGAINANLMSMRTLRAEFALTPEVDPQRFERLAAELLTADLQTRHIAAAPDLVIRYIYPETGNESALGFDYRDNPEQYASILAAIEAGDIVLNGPVELVQGGQALIGRVPVYETEGGEFWGVLSIVIDHMRLFREVGLTGNGRWRLGLRGRNGEGIAGEIILGTPGLWDDDPVTVSVDLPVGRWVLAAAPKTGSWQKPLSAFGTTWLAGTLMNLAIAVLVLGLLLSRRRLQGALSTISHQARFDGLTELPNRQYFMYQLGEVIHTARREGSRFALLFIDLDHFKEINDSLGHEAGDELLQSVARRIRSAVRGNDVVGRFGGDEFIVLLRDLGDPVDAEFVASKILKALHPSVSVHGHEVTIDGSIGIAVYPEDGQSPSDLLKHADLAMYAAKSAGRGTSHFFNESLRHQAEAHLQLHNEIKRGLDNGQFEVYYQPIVEARGQRIVAVEALVRWHHPKRGLVGPDQFIPVAERTGVIRSLGEFVLKRACRDLHAMERAGLELRLSVNRSSREFNDRHIVKRWLDIVDRSRVARQRVTFEITESVLMPDRSRQHRLLRRLNAEGLHLAIDDFGQGYSSITYLRQFPVAQVKIDRVFVCDIERVNEQRSLVEAMIKIAEALSLEVVAEGVETQVQADLLRDMGCGLLQGFHFGRPVPLDDLIEAFGRTSAGR